MKRFKILLLLIAVSVLSTTATEKKSSTTLDLPYNQQLGRRLGKLGLRGFGLRKLGQLLGQVHRGKRETDLSNVAEIITDVMFPHIAIMKLIVQALSKKEPPTAPTQDDIILKKFTDDFMSYNNTA